MPLVTNAILLIHFRGQPVKEVRHVRANVAGNDEDGTHAMRHSAATWLTRDGSVPVPEIASCLGMIIETLRSVYWQCAVAARIMSGGGFHLNNYRLGQEAGERLGRVIGRASEA